MNDGQVELRGSKRGAAPLLRCDGGIRAAVLQAAALQSHRLNVLLTTWHSLETSLVWYLVSQTSYGRRIASPCRPDFARIGTEPAQDQSIVERPESIDSSLKREISIYWTIRLLVLHCDSLSFELLLHGIDIERLLARPHELNVRHIRVLVAFEDGINLFKAEAFSLHPEICLSTASVTPCARLEWSTYNQADDHDVPAGIDEVHPPSDVCEADWHYEDEDDTGHNQYESHERLCPTDAKALSRS